MRFLGLWSRLRAGQETLIERVKEAFTDLNGLDRN